MDPGTALGAVSLTFDVFAGCVKAFGLISDAGNLGRDAALERTRLLLQEHRLVEWAKAVHIDVPGASIAPGVNQSLAALLLTQLEQTLSSTEHLRQRYHLELVVENLDSLELEQSRPATDKHENAQSILAKLISPQTRKEILSRSSKVKGSSALTKRLWWAAVDKQKLSALVLDVTGLVDGLWTLLDTASKVRASQLADRQLAGAVDSSTDVTALRQLQSALEPGGTGSSLNDVISASAGLKAIILSSVAPPAGTKQDNPTEPLEREMALLIDSAQLTGTQKVAHGQLTIAKLGQERVLVEDKHVQQTKMKKKLRPRVVELAALLSVPTGKMLFTLPCVGYIEEAYGFRLVFSLSGTTSLRLPSPEPTTLLTLVSDSKFALPSAGVRLRLALQIAKSVFAFHAAGWLHKDIRSANVVIVPSASSSSAKTPTFDLSHPILAGFSFARRDAATEISESISERPDKDIYRHSRALGDEAEGFTRYMDAYGLGCVLLEVAEWAPLRKIVRPCVDTSQDAKISDIAILPRWIRSRYMEPGGRAAFRLGAPFATLLGLCFPEEDRQVELAEFLDALEELSRCWLGADALPEERNSSTQARLNN